MSSQADPRPHRRLRSKNGLRPFSDPRASYSGPIESGAPLEEPSYNSRATKDAASTVGQRWVLHLGRATVMPCSGQSHAGNAPRRLRAGVWDPVSVRRDCHKPELARAELRAIRGHDLRHTAASLRRAAGVPPCQVSRWLSHAGIITTDTIYGHTYPTDYA